MLRRNLPAFPGIILLDLALRAGLRSAFQQGDHIIRYLDRESGLRLACVRDLGALRKTAPRERISLSQ